jgi:hypothetical protein
MFVDAAPKSMLTQAEFYAATWDVVNSPSTAVATWGDIGDWKVGGVKDFSHAFSRHRNEKGCGGCGGTANPKAAFFDGRGIEAWDTSGCTDMHATFNEATMMNADLSNWNVANVIKLDKTFRLTTVFAGVGLDKWVVTKLSTMVKCFDPPNAITSCDKHKISDAWKTNAAFIATTYDTDWATGTCTVRV